MSSDHMNGAQPHTMTSLERVSHIPIVSSGISSLHATLSTTPLVRIAYSLSLSVSSQLKPYVESASTHYPFAPVISYSDRAANKTLDIAEKTWPYPFRSNPEQVWNDVCSVADSRVVKPAVGVAKSVDNHLTPLVDTFSFVVKKIDSKAEDKAHPSPNDYQLRRAYALLLVLKDDMLKTANVEQNAIMKNIHGILTRLTEHSAALRSASEDAASRVQALAHAVLSELDKLSPLVSSLTHNTSTTLKDTASNIRGILGSADPLGQKIPKLGTAIQGGVQNVLEDVVEKVHELVDDIRASSSASSTSSDSVATPDDDGSTRSTTKQRNKRNNDRKASSLTNGAVGSPSKNRT